MEKLKIEYVDIESIKPYVNNAKKHPEEQIEQIKKSIEKFGMDDPIGIWKNEIVEGHGRLIACKQLGMTEVPIIRLDHLTDEERKAYTLAHNKLTMNSDFDLDILNDELDDILNIDMSDFGFDISEIGRRRASWARTEKYCDLKRRLKQHFDGGMVVSTLYETGKRGIPILEIKENPDNVALFADNLVDYLSQLLGDNLAAGDWCIVTTPRRRHKEGFHFSTAICQTAAEMLNLPFYVDAFTAENRDRIEPEFHMEKNPEERNVLVYDDIITTGQTIRAVRQLLLDSGHVVLCVVGIKN